MNKYGSKWIRPNKRKRIYARDNYTCYMCSARLDEVAPASRTLDHIVPRSGGGSNHETNLVTACAMCNSTRRDAPLSTELLERAMAWARMPLPVITEGVQA